MATIDNATPAQALDLWRDGKLVSQTLAPYAGGQAVPGITKGLYPPEEVDERVQGFLDTAAAIGYGGTVPEGQAVVANGATVPIGSASGAGVGSGTCTVTGRALTRVVLPGNLAVVGNGGGVNVDGTMYYFTVVNGVITGASTTPP